MVVDDEAASSGVLVVQEVCARGDDERASAGRRQVGRVCGANRCAVGSIAAARSGASVVVLRNTRIAFAPLDSSGQLVTVIATAR